MSSEIERAPSQLHHAAGAAPAVQAEAEPQGKRLLFVDNLRILLICGVLVQHLSDTYGSAGSWMYRDPATADTFTSTFLTALNSIGMAAGMGFFFLLAGYFTPDSYDRKGGVAFLRDRIIRLGLPWLVYSLLFQPLVYYIAKGLPGSFWNFYPTYLHRVDSIADGPIWFVELLLFFSILYVAWRWLARTRAQADSGKGTTPGYRAIFGFILALGIGSFVVRIWWPQYDQPGPLNLPLGYLLQYVCFYVLGIVAYRRNWLFTLTPRMGRDWSLIALLATFPFYGVAIPYVLGGGTAGGQPGIELAGGFHWLSLAYALWESFVIVGVCIGLLALFRTRLNHQGSLARGLTASVYTVYLIHPVVLVGFSYAFHVVTLYPLLKWGIAVLVTLPLCFLISGLIRKIPLANRVL
ncbi:MAG TPA: acyltransferase family protein [Ktedonobacteraceae bacterium]|nr:acyltransferase family protein [Ktedonobacteraceae bacterium]